jgi:hypothetical protein
METLLMGERNLPNREGITFHLCAADKIFYTVKRAAMITLTISYMLHNHINMILIDGKK